MESIVYRHPKQKEALEIFQNGSICFEMSRFPYSIWSLDEVRKFIKKPNIAIVVEINGNIVGFVGAHAQYKGLPDDHGFLEWAFVLPEYRRQGILSELIKRVEQQYIQLGKRFILFDTTPDNHAIQDFIHKEGYEKYVEDIFYRKNLFTQQHQLTVESNSQSTDSSHSSRLLQLLQAPERFIGSILFALIIAQLLSNLRIQSLTISSALVFFALLILIARWGHIEVSLYEREFQYSPTGWFSQLVGYWCTYGTLGALFIAASYQSDLVVVCFSIGSLAAFDLFWEINAVRDAKRNNQISVIRTLNRWIFLDILTIAVLTGILFGIHMHPDWTPWPILSVTVYPLVLFLLMFAISVGDYMGDYYGKIDFYFSTKS
ncbi:GNAT family N-acetyltransferase [Chloroflexota bacterium]